MMGKPSDLHRIHDGEISAEERHALDAALDGDDRLRLAALDDLGSALRNTFEAESEGFDVAAAVMKKLEPIRPPSVWARIAAAVRSYRMVWIPGVAAAAIVAVFYVGPWRSVVTDECEIESLEVSGAAATVMKVPDVHGEGTSTIVWLDEEEEGEAQ